MFMSIVVSGIISSDSWIGMKLDRGFAWSDGTFLIFNYWGNVQVTFLFLLNV